MKEPKPNFSACFGAPFLVWHPTVYAELLAKLMREHEAPAYLVNTGWSGGAYGTGTRMSLGYTRAIIDAIHDGSLAKAETIVDPVFGLATPAGLCARADRAAAATQLVGGHRRLRRDRPPGWRGSCGKLPSV